MDDVDARSVRTLDKAVMVLEYLGRQEKDIDLASLAQELKMPKTTLLRLLNTLKKHNFVQKDEVNRRYRLGWALIYLGQAANKAFSVVELIHPFLTKLARETGETANLVFLDKDRAIYVDQVVSDSIIRGVPAVGTPLGLYCTAAGKAMLSCLADDRVKKILNKTDLKKLTDKTIADRDLLYREIEQVRVQGYALDDEETELGGRCLSAPILGREEALVGAISVMGPINRVNPQTYSALSGMVKKAAREISNELGHPNKPG